MSLPAWIRISFIAFIFGCTLSAKCATTSVGPGGATSDASAPSPVGAFVHCTTDAVTATGQRLLPDVANALVTESYEAAIADLLLHFLPDEVKCGIELFLDSTLRKASADRNVAEQVRRGRAYLQEHP